MSDSLRTASEFVEYSEKLSAERRKLDIIDLKIKKVVETTAPIDVCDEQRRIDYWSQVLTQSNQQYEKKILIYEEQIAYFQRMIDNAKLERDKPDFRPRFEVRRAEKDLELKKTYKPKDLHKLEIERASVEKKIESFKNLLGMSKPDPPAVKKITTPSPPPPSSKPENPPGPKAKRVIKVVTADNTVDTASPAERPPTPVPEPIPAVVPLPPPVAESSEPKLIQNTKVLRTKKVVPA
jgi:hypothetical protein